MTGPRYAKKSEWAEAQADELYKSADALKYQSSAGSSMKAARKYQAIDRLCAEAARFKRVASALRRKGK